MRTFVDVLRLHVGVAVLLDLAEHHVIQTLDLGLVGWSVHEDILPESQVQVPCRDRRPDTLEAFTTRWKAPLLIQCEISKVLFGGLMQLL